jgi:hypothetical protein
MNFKIVLLSITVLISSHKPIKVREEKMGIGNKYQKIICPLCLDLAREQNFIDIPVCDPNQIDFPFCLDCPINREKLVKN